MLEALNRYWREYLMEAAGLAGFIIGASLLTVLLEHPELPVMRSPLGDYPTLRRVPLGLGMGAYIAGVIYMWGERSGAHINPAVTWTFFRLGKIKLVNALFYTLAQFAGAILAALLMKRVLGELYAHPSIHFTTTEPGKGAHAIEAAFLAEFIISFVLMLMVLLVINSVRLEKLAALFTGLLLAVYLVVETPYSGMSLNPARSTGSAFAAWQWMDLWIYFVSPMLAMLLAAETFLWLKKMWLNKASWYKESPTYPVQEAPAALDARAVVSH